MEEPEPNKENPNATPTEQPESTEETQGDVIEIKIKDGVGAAENP